MPHAAATELPRRIERASGEDGRAASVDRRRQGDEERSPLERGPPLARQMRCLDRSAPDGGGRDRGDKQCQSRQQRWHTAREEEKDLA